MTELKPYLSRKAQILNTRRQELRDDPGAGVARLSATSYVAGITGIRPVRMGEYTVNTDSGAGLAGHGLGPSSPELLLGALASCLAHTYVLQAALRDIALDHVAIETSGALDLGAALDIDATAPLSINELSYQADIRSTEAPARIDALHDHVDKACAVLNTIRYSQPISRAT